MTHAVGRARPCLSSTRRAQPNGCACLQGSYCSLVGRAAPPPLPVTPLHPPQPLPPPLSAGGPWPAGAVPGSITGRGVLGAGGTVTARPPLSACSRSARPRTAAASPSVGLWGLLSCSVGRQQSSPSRPVAAGGLRPAQPRPPCLASVAGRAAPAGAVIVLPMPRPLTGCRAEGAPNNCDGRAVGAGVGPSPGIVPPPCPPSRAGRCAGAQLSRPAPTLAARCAASTPTRNLGRLLRARQGNDW